MATDIVNSAAWGTLVAVNRDGTDGARYTLAGEFMIVGRTGADITFEDDRFLAREHARFERDPSGASVIPASQPPNDKIVP